MCAYFRLCSCYFQLLPLVVVCQCAIVCCVSSAPAVAFCFSCLFVFLVLSVLYNYNVYIIPFDGIACSSTIFLVLHSSCLLHFVDVDLFVVSLSFAHAFCVLVGLFCFVYLPACLHILYIVCHDDVHDECVDQCNEL